MVELIIAEKPQQATKIAEALADKKPQKKTINKVYYYELKHKGKSILVGCAVGHLFNLAEREKKGLVYPVFDIEWRPSWGVSKTSAFTKEYLNVLANLAKKADSFTVACDYDIEGSTIGFNCIRFICNKKDAKRMKFSTLTKEELINSYEHASPHLNFPLIEAGEARHFMDFFYGVSLSRALISAIKAAGLFKILSAGRVQGPALKIIVDREKEIRKFKPVPFWQIELLGTVSKASISAWHKKDKFWEKDEADNVIKKIKGKKAVVSKVEKTKFKQAPPIPFDLTTLQTEAYRTLHIGPKQTLALAQRLYLAGLISYPRTASQKLPVAIGYKKILSLIAKQKTFSALCSKLLSKKMLKPTEGKKTDAHPAIYPTGEIGKIEGKTAQLYDLIVRRFLSTFGDPAVKETVVIEIDVNKELFIAKGTRTIEKGWYVFYGKYASFKEEELPNVKKGQEVKVKEIKLHAKETQPPKRFTPASIVKELERRSLGTKATRALIIDTLYQRNYIMNEPIEATSLGVKITETLEKWCPEIVDEELTRHFEQEMDQIQEGKKKKEQILEESKKLLTKALNKFRAKELEIGKELVEVTKKAELETNVVGICPACKKGKLRIIWSRKTKKRFVACNAYPKCKTTFSLPSQGLIKPMKEPCKECGFPRVTVIRAGKRFWILCLNPDCPTKEKWAKNKK